VNYPKNDSYLSYMDQNRYLSLDVLRGMTVTLMIIVNTPGNGETTFAPLQHAVWHGFTPTDWVFPTFMFVVGNALSFAMGKYEALGNTEVFKKIFKRTFIIFILGYLMYWFPFITQTDGGAYELSPIGNTRIFGVLQRIALGYGLSALIIHFWKLRGAIIFSVIALLAYWVILFFFGDYTLTGNAVLSLDKYLLGENHLYHGEGIAFDPEGILSTLPAIVNVVAGYVAGKFIQQMGNTYEAISKMLMAGVVLIFVALCWDLVFPINKKLWTSSFVLLTVGLDLVVLAILIYVIEFVKSQRWTYFFEVFGKNTLFIYLLSEVGIILLYFFNRYTWIFDHVFLPAFGGYVGSLLFAVCWMLICWTVGYILDKKKIYIKV
jgi:predicted acyltransferase